MCVHHASGQAHFHRFGFADESRQSLGAAGPWNNAKLDLGLAEAGVVCRQDKVAHHGEFASSAQRVAGHSRNYWFSTACDLLPVASNKVSKIHVHVRTLLHPLDIGASRKGFFTPGDNHGSDSVVLLEVCEGLAHLVHQAVRQGIESIRPVKGNQSHVFAGLGQDVFVTHEDSFGEANTNRYNGPWISEQGGAPITVRDLVRRRRKESIRPATRFASGENVAEAGCSFLDGL